MPGTAVFDKNNLRATLITDNESEQEVIIDDTLDHRPKGFKKLINLLAALLRTAAIWFSIFSILSLTGIGLIPIAVIASVVAGTYGLKDYFKTQSAKQSGSELYATHYTGKQKAKAILGLIFSVLCAIAMESLFIAGIFTFAAATLNPISAPLALAVIIIAAVLGVISIINDSMFYWNCFRKFFILPKTAKEDEKPLPNWQKHLLVGFIITSTVAATLLYVSSCIMTFAGIGTAFGPVGTIIGLVLGTIIALVGAAGNFFIMCQTHREWSATFEEASTKPTSFVERISHFNNLYAETLTRKLTAYGESVAGAVPVVRAIVTNPLFKNMPIAGLIAIGVVTAFITAYSAYSYNKATINRFRKYLGRKLSFKRLPIDHAADDCQTDPNREFSETLPRDLAEEQRDNHHIKRRRSVEAANLLVPGYRQQRSHSESDKSLLIDADFLQASPPASPTYKMA